MEKRKIWSVNIDENFSIDAIIVDFKRRYLPNFLDMLVICDDKGTVYNIECSARLKDDKVIFGYGDMAKTIELGMKANIRVHSKREISKTRLMLRTINIS